MSSAELSASDRDRLRNWRWVGIDHRRKHMPKRHLDWHDLVEETGQPRGNSIYIHSLSDDEIHGLEHDCIVSGNLVFGDRDVRGIYWSERPEIIGASKGEETRFIRVELSSRNYHGRPATQREIEELCSKAGIEGGLRP